MSQTDSPDTTDADDRKTVWELRALDTLAENLGNYRSDDALETGDLITVQVGDARSRTELNGVITTDDTACYHFNAEDGSTYRIQQANKPLLSGLTITPSTGDDADTIEREREITALKRHN